MDSILSVLGGGWIVVLLLLFFGFSIFVHELGHFLVARWCGLVIETFAIGFGPSIWQRKYKGVLYKIGCFPVGGYVALPQLDPSGMSRIQGTSADGTVAADLPAVAPWKKICVSVAGAVGNILLAIVLAWAVYLIGMPAGPAERSSMVGFVADDSAAYAAGLRIGDVVTDVSGKPVKSWTDVRMEVAYHQEVTLGVRAPDNSTRKISLPTTPGLFGEQHLPGVEGPSLCMVMRTQPGQSAEKAGLRTDDVIVRFAGEDIVSRPHLIQLVGANENIPVEIVVRRRVDGVEQQVASTITPVRDAALDMVRIGIEFNLAAVEHDTVVRPKPMEQIRTHATAIFRFLGALGTPTEAKAASKAVGGPVAILVSYWYIVKASPMLAIWFTGFLNVNLAILNLLPLPVLDGGHICFSLYEMIWRRPLHPKFVTALVNVFAVLLIGLIILLTVRDFDRFTPVGRVMRGWFATENVDTNKE